MTALNAAAKKNSVNSYDTGSRLRGAASEELARESAAVGDTGAVPAYRDAQGVWQYVQPSQVSTYEARGETIVTVWVD